MAYSLLRRIWYTHNWSTIRAYVCKCEKKDRDERRKALIGNQIVEPFLPPRRVWDLYSNRVVPRWIMDIDDVRAVWRLWPDPISHAWVDEKDRADVWTPINGYEWPVPVPKESDLKLIRIEMLNLGLEYAWLDVLCLRQVGGPGEDMRTEEWKLDVPVIGAMYRQTEVVCYLSGLGRPLSLKEGDLDSDRCWFRRAWTLQEVGDKMVIAGDTPNGPMHANLRKGRKYETELLTRFHKQLESTVDITHCIVSVALGEMQNRVSTKPVDKVAGLAFLLWPETIPAYYEGQSLEEAWTALVNSMLTLGRGELFSLFPEPGNARAKWRPSWDQVMMKPLPTYDHGPHIFVHRDETGDEDSCDVYYIEKGLVQGLAVVEGGPRRGKLIFKNKGGIERGFKIIANHTYPIPEDTYTLIDPGTVDLGMSCYRWVVGRSLPGGMFEKVSLVEIPRKKERRRLKKLRITEKRRYILI
ncbi:uncharacterized protein EV420DRAFT_1317369 [Desarmillaria tabescens]|uniref:Heterokaryon incompatibility domain-containing protein n=1 Tax=Armillaria tabescens TaxID=1929756 RepID=A0AA39J560_ARMTA|nr:uncharacterized protein EV420DRAFT_1317369 [Desarmillaria tabescens]KAK0436341.1 hypothetical protein EV420DRAFT_1317369 [Desarmillaria tabescens]